MRSVRNLFALATLLVLALGLGACAPATEEVDTDALQAEAWAQVQQARESLQAKRQELRDLRNPPEDAEAGDDGATAEDAGEATEGGEAVNPEERIAAFEQEITTLTEEFNGQLIDFINSQDLYEGQDLTEIQRAAFNMKAEEDVLVAQEYVDRAGNYQKAIDIFTTSLLADPGNTIILEAKAKAEELRFMTEERFGVVKKGMSEAEVRKALGTPQPVNVREYEDRGVIAWFYPKAERKAAAGVYFKERRGKLEVYNVDFNAIAAEEEDAG